MYKVSALLSIALFALPSIVKAEYGVEFASCVSTDYVPNQGLQQPVQAGAYGCGTHCYATNPAWIYSAYITDTQQCYCGTNSFTPAQVVTGGSGVCGSNYEVSIDHTTFDFSYCSNTLTVDDAQPLLRGSTSDYASIFTACRTYGGAAIYPTGDGLFLYSCGFDYAVSDGGVATQCGYEVNRVYYHDPDSTASGLARRSMNERRRIADQELLEAYWCPKGLTACALEHDSSSFECLDIKNELESCGGCLFGAYNPPGYANVTVPIGQDCSAIEGVSMGHSSCIDGACQFDCKKGYEIEGDRCVKA